MPTLLEKRFVTELPKHNFKVEPAMKAAGYARKTARYNQKRTINQEGVKELLAEVSIASKEEVVRELRYVGYNQRKDLSSKLKVLIPLAKKYDIDLTEDEASSIKNITNILNVRYNSIDDIRRAIEAEISEIKALEAGTPEAASAK